jgi:hypothetical protein
MQLDYEGLFAALNTAGIRYLLTGGVAVKFHIEALRKLGENS